MQSSTSLGLDFRESLDNNDRQSQYYDASEEQVNNGIGEINEEGLINPSKSIHSTTRDRAGIRPSSARTASVPIIQYGGTYGHRRSSNSTSQTHSRPTTSGQTSTRRASTAPTSTHSSRPNSRRYSAFVPLGGPSGSLPRDTRSLLRRSATAAPRPPTSNYASIFPDDDDDNEDDDPPPTFRAISYPGRSSENIGSRSSPNIPISPLSPTDDRQHSITSILGDDPASAIQHTYTNYTPPANIDWTSPETRRKHYSKIDKATTGFRGVWTRFAPKKLGGGSKYGSFYGGKDGDAASVRRFRQDLGDGEGEGVEVREEGRKGVEVREEGGKGVEVREEEGKGQTKRRFFSLGGRKASKSSSLTDASVRSRKRH